MTEMLDLDTARSRYVEWFVKRHYLQKKGIPTWGVHAWEISKERGYIRYEKLIWSKNSSIYPCGREELRDEFDYQAPFFFCMTENRPEKSWWRIAITDLDNPINDNNEIVKKYRQYRQNAADAAVMKWLLAEAEYYVVTNEAWLRAYGIEVEAA